MAAVSRAVLKIFNKNNFAMLVIVVAENYTPIDWKSFKKKALWANIANY